MNSTTYMFKGTPTNDSQFSQLLNRAQSLNLSLGALAEIVSAQLEILGEQLTMWGASCSKAKVKSLTVPRLYVISVFYFYFSPVIDQLTIVIFRTYFFF